MTTSKDLTAIFNRLCTPPTPEEWTQIEKDRIRTGFRSSTSWMRDPYGKRGDMLVDEADFWGM